MKNPLIIILSFFITACSSLNTSSRVSLDLIGATIALPSQAEINFVPATSFGEPAKLRVISHKFSSPEEFSSYQNAGVYYDFFIYEGRPWNVNANSIIKALCLSEEARVEEEMTDESDNYRTLRLSSDCFSMRTFAVIYNNILYEIRAGQDTVDYQGIWKALKSLDFQ